MSERNHFEIIIVGGSYSGLSAAMALGRAMRKVLIIDSANPCNKQTPYSHNFITHDGKSPNEIATLARQQVSMYGTIELIKDVAIFGKANNSNFEIMTESGNTYSAEKLIFATGIKDIMPDIKGFSECWGISVLHCPYCHGYEVRNNDTGILGNGEIGFELCRLISNWTNDLTLFTNGKSTLTLEQTEQLRRNNIKTIEKEITSLEHSNGYIKNIIFEDNSNIAISTIYSKCPFEQNSNIPQILGCDLTDEGYILTDSFQKTSVKGIYACGDAISRMRTVSYAVATGTIAGIMVNKELIEDKFTKGKK
jgi:thioredoxin reductase